MAQSGFERNLQFQIHAAKLPAPRTQYRFHPIRMWTFDFAWPDYMLYVEVEGGIYKRNGSGRHTRGKGFERDCVKYAEACILGWRGLRVTTDHVRNGLALQLVERALRYTMTSDDRPSIGPDVPGGGAV